MPDLVVISNPALALIIDGDLYINHEQLLRSSETEAKTAG